MFNYIYRKPNCYLRSCLALVMLKITVTPLCCHFIGTTKISGIAEPFTWDFKAAALGTRK